MDQSIKTIFLYFKALFFAALFGRNYVYAFEIQIQDSNLSAQESLILSDHLDEVKRLLPKKYSALGNIRLMVKDFKRAGIEGAHSSPGHH